MKAPRLSLPKFKPDEDYWAKPWLALRYCPRPLVALRCRRSGDFSNMRVVRIVALCAALGGCAQIERAEIAQTAQSSMIGMPREQVLACMGPPAQKATEGQTEVWAYNTSPTIMLNQGSGATRYCSVNIVMSGGAVSAVNYRGPTGGLISRGEQCAYAVDACVKR